MTNLIFIISSVSRGFEFKSNFNIQKFRIKILNFFVKYLIIDQKIYQEQTYTKVFNLADNHC